jgi:membrane-associated phospholipid phosphatase
MLAAFDRFAFNNNSYRWHSPECKGDTMKKIIKPLWLLLVALAVNFAVTARADEVTDWNQIMFRAARVPPATTPLDITRVAAIVHAAVFDAINGIERRYTPIHVEPAAPRGASRRAAAVQAAYATLVKLYPSQKPALDLELAASLDAIASGAAGEHSVSIARGIEWGQTVADAILAWRATDGFTPAPPPFVGGLGVGQWRPTPPAFAPGAGPQFAYMSPWVIGSPSQFRPAGPPALTSARYTADFNETKIMGSVSSATRTSDQTIACLFWASTTASYLWNHAAVVLCDERNTTLSENARLFALLNLAVADAAISCWEAKYYYVFWRPITAIRLAATDGNPDTVADPIWAPLRATPAHPEYPSGHSSFSGAAATVLADFFGEESEFSMDSDGMPDVIRSFTSFSGALDEVTDARVFAGIHFRSACDDARAAGIAVADHVMANALQPVNGNHNGQN